MSSSEEGHVACTCHKGHAPHHRKAQATNATKKTAAGRESTEMSECQQNEGRHHQAVLFFATLKEHLEPIVLDNQNVEAAWGALRVTKHQRE